MESKILPSTATSSQGTRHWPHAPPHRLALSGVYMVTARTAEGSDLLAEDEMKDWFQNLLLDVLEASGWRAEAWAILSNHYHFIAHSPSTSEGGGAALSLLIRKLHSLSTQERNRRDGTYGRTRLWQNFRETHLTHQQSYLARLHYVHQNAVHHGLVAVGSDWKWCSAAKFKAAVTPAWVATIASFRYDQSAAKDGE